MTTFHHQYFPEESFCPVCGEYAELSENFAFLECDKCDQSYWVEYDE